MFKGSFKTLLLGSTLLAASFVSYAENMHKVWDQLVNQNVVAINNGHSTVVNYAAMQAQHSELTTYLKMLSAVSQNEFDDWGKTKQLAFLINAYNAWTVELIVTNLSKDGSDLKSIKDLGGFFSSPWSKKFIPLLGETRSLDNIEHDLIRGAVDEKGKPKYNDPRIHFAVNCASIGCPALREEAYTADKLLQQLEQQTVRFLSDTTRNFAQSFSLSLSSIFKWYGEDFEKGYNNTHSLEEFMLQYPEALNLTPVQQKALKEGDMKIQFLKYNWDLNAQH
ncbi:DUF547 domain-containing protein [Pseudocolwellia agarivorans]|uniref:DUF547 domain-containing protein n=1 Tax=Pseudocolwellia agarivorans TaxID=1911682 RepID=UPI00098769E6|nr:DUF547 domain-containing protein [Pseudocolwellia agarivorans]